MKHVSHHNLHLSLSPDFLVRLSENLTEMRNVDVVAIHQRGSFGLSGETCALVSGVFIQKRIQETPPITLYNFTQLLCESTAPEN